MPPTHLRPAGQYQCKLVIARSNRGSVVCWEGGPNRQLRVPHLGGLEVPPGVPLWQGVCRFGDTSKTQLKASPSVHPQQLKVRGGAGRGRPSTAASQQRCAGGASDGCGLATPRDIYPRSMPASKCPTSTCARAAAQPGAWLRHLHVSCMPRSLLARAPGAGRRHGGGAAVRRAGGEARHADGPAGPPGPRG